MNENHKVFLENYLDTILDTIEIFQSKEMLHMLILNENNTTGMILDVDELNEELFEVLGYAPINELFNNNTTICELQNIFNQVFGLYFDGKATLKEIIHNTNWSRFMEQLKKTAQVVSDVLQEDISPVQSVQS